MVPDSVKCCFLCYLKTNTDCRCELYRHSAPHPPNCSAEGGISAHPLPQPRAGLVHGDGQGEHGDDDDRAPGRNGTVTARNRAVVPARRRRRSRGWLPCGYSFPSGTTCRRSVAGRRRAGCRRGRPGLLPAPLRRSACAGWAGALASASAYRRPSTPAVCRARASAPAKGPRPTASAVMVAQTSFRHRAQRIEQEAERRAWPGQREEQAGDGGEQGADDGNGQRFPDAPAHLAQPLGRQIGREEAGDEFTDAAGGIGAQQFAETDVEEAIAGDQCRRRSLRQRAGCASRTVRPVGGRGVERLAQASRTNHRPQRPAP